MRNASTATRRGIGLGTVRSTWRGKRKKKKGSEASASSINIIEINIVVSSNDSWVFDTRSMIHTCKSL
jgi:hypothetical protein